MRCVCGDARDEAAYARALSGEKADALVTDPPYCLLTRRRKGGDLRDPKGRKIDREPVVRYESVRDYRAFTEAWLPKAVNALKPSAPAIIWTNFFGREPIRAAARACGYLHEAGEFVWAKRTKETSGAAEQLLRVYEVALVFTREPLPPATPSSAAAPWSAVAGYDDDGEAARWGSHPHHKPFGVLEPLLRQWTRAGELVLDPFAGSGSIPAAAVKLQRRVACIELKPEWVDRINERIC